METFLKTLPIAHRGLHTDFPENTLPAFSAAIEHGYAIETDVRLTADGKWIVFHDDTLARMTGDERRADACTLAEIRALSIGGEAIPTLAELLETVAGKTPLLIEIKDMKEKPARIAELLSEGMKGYAGEYAVQSFNPLYAKAYKKLHPEVMCGVLGMADRSAFGSSMKEKFRAHIVRKCPRWLFAADFLSYRLEDLPLRMQKKFPLTLAWTVRNEEQEKTARTVADNIIFENFLPTL